MQTESCYRGLGQLRATSKIEHRVRYTDRQGRGIMLYGELVCPAEEGPFPVVILCHGFNGHYSDFPMECERLAAHGYLCYCFDFCAAQTGGKSTGREADAYTVYTMIEDLKAVIADIKSLELAGGQMFLFGASQGGLVTGLAAAEIEVRNQVNAIAMYFPAFNIPDDWRGAPARKTFLMGYSIGQEYIRSIQELDPYAFIGRFTGDVCIVCGDMDEVVRRETIDRAVQVYGEERVAITVISGAGHGFIGAQHTVAVDALLHFLKAHMA